MTGATTVSIVLPALNEAASIGRVVSDLRERADEVVVVDNGSTDATSELAAAAGARVVLEPRRGFGSACFAGTVAAHGEVVCFLDADGTFAPADVTRVIDEVASGRIDLCLGSRTLRPGAIRFDHRVVNRALGLTVRLAGCPRLTDIGPLRAVHRDVLLSLGVEDRAFAWPLEMIIRAARAGLTIREIPVDYLPRFGGTSKVTGSLRGSLRVARQMGVLLAREALPVTVTLALIAKEPGSARAKTRLAATLGQGAAERLARALLLDSVSSLIAAAPPDARLVLAHDPPDAAERLRTLGVPSRFACVPQGPGSLGDRLERLLRNELDGGAEACVIAATDSPFALAAIRDCIPRHAGEIVLAPCRDGGYWAVGAARPAPIFAVTMSTDDVLAETVAEAEAAGYAVRLLEPTLDIDTESDLEAAAAEKLLARAPRTAAEWQRTPIAR